MILLILVNSSFDEHFNNVLQKKEYLNKLNQATVTGTKKKWA
jgi:hypothetical protein